MQCCWAIWVILPSFAFYFFSQIFCDFGDSFTVCDDTGEACLSGIISSITQSTNGIVTCHEDIRHNLQDDQLVTFKEVQGMHQLNNCMARRIKVISKDSFSIGDPTAMGEYTGGGLFEQVKEATKISFVRIRVFVFC